MTGWALIIAFVVAIVLMILLISKLKVHPFLAIMGISLLLALLAGIKLTDIPDIIGAGFSGTFTSIGIVIILGAFIGSVLEKTGAALKLADMVIRLVGEKHPELAIELMGWVVSIPVFCDSGFVILNPIRKALVKRTGVSSVAMTVCLSCGLYISHVFIPPTPGPIAAANTLGVGDNLLLVIGIGVLGKVISSSDMVNFIKENANVLQAIGIFFPFLLAAILKSAQGSSTVAITTSAGIVAPLLATLGFTAPVEIALVVMAIGAGAMTVSHANDSYFWVVTNFGEMKTEEGYRTQTLMTLVIGIAAMIEIFILSLIF